MPSFPPKADIVHEGDTHVKISVIMAAARQTDGQSLSYYIDDGREVRLLIKGGFSLQKNGIAATQTHFAASKSSIFLDTVFA